MCFTSHRRPIFGTEYYTLRIWCIVVALTACSLTQAIAIPYTFPARRYPNCQIYLSTLIFHTDRIAMLKGGGYDEVILAFGPFGGGRCWQMDPSKSLIIGRAYGPHLPKLRQLLDCLQCPQSSISNPNPREKQRGSPGTPGR